MSLLWIGLGNANRIDWNAAGSAVKWEAPVVFPRRGGRMKAFDALRWCLQMLGFLSNFSWLLEFTSRFLYSNTSLNVLYSSIYGQLMAYAPYFTVFESNPINSSPYLLAGKIDIYSLLFVCNWECVQKYQACFLCSMKTFVITHKYISLFWSLFLYSSILRNIIWMWSLKLCRLLLSCESILKQKNLTVILIFLGLVITVVLDILCS